MHHREAQASKGCRLSSLGCAASVAGAQGAGGRTGRLGGQQGSRPCTRQGPPSPLALRLRAARVAMVMGPCEVICNVTSIFSIQRFMCFKLHPDLLIEHCANSWMRKSRNRGCAGCAGGASLSTCVPMHQSASNMPGGLDQLWGLLRRAGSGTEATTGGTARHTLHRASHTASGAVCDCVLQPNILGAAQLP